MAIRKYRVLIVDDSSIIRTLFAKIISMSDELEVIGSAPDPYIAREMIIKHKPDVMTLDIEMPRMDGITFLGKLMKSHPVRTVVISSLSPKNSELALAALDAGAIEVLEKPSIDVAQSLEKQAKLINEKIATVARARLPDAFQLSLKKRAPIASGTSLKKTTHQILAIASSTGGTEALKEVLPRLPADIPGTLVVQHMPATFTKSFADNLNKMCQFTVTEAKHGDRVLPGHVLIAPGNYHMELYRSGAYYYVSLNQEPPMHGVRPAADILMNSVAKVAGKNAVGVVLTGMGKDGAAGLKAMKEAGSYNFAQDEKSCIVFGMPAKAIELDAHHKIVPLQDMAEHVLRAIEEKSKLPGDTPIKKAG